MVGDPFPGVVHRAGVPGAVGGEGEGAGDGWPNDVPGGVGDRPLGEQGAAAIPVAERQLWSFQKWISCRQLIIRLASTMDEG